MNRIIKIHKNHTGGFAAFDQGVPADYIRKMNEEEEEARLYRAVVEKFQEAERTLNVLRNREIKPHKTTKEDMRKWERTVLLLS